MVSTGIAQFLKPGRTGILFVTQFLAPRVLTIGPKLLNKAPTYLQAADPLPGGHPVRASLHTEFYRHSQSEQSDLLVFYEEAPTFRGQPGNPILDS
jgi:hypothetical protein